MKIIQISDIHLSKPGDRLAGLDVHDRLLRALAHINEHHTDARRVIISGDLTQDAEPEAYEWLGDVVARQTIPVRLMIGNHDDRNTFRAAFPEHPCDEHGYINHAETIDGVRYLYLDTCEPKTHAGHFGDDRLAWLDKELKRHDKARLFLHHQPMLLGLPSVDLIGLNAQDRMHFKTLLEEHRQSIQFMHFGHVHATIHGTYCGIGYASAPSTWLQSIPDMNETELLNGAPMESAYCVILAEGTDTTIHQVPYTWDGPVLMAGTQWEE